MRRLWLLCLLDGDYLAFLAEQFGSHACRHPAG
jgi:hypothetical protein